MTEDRYHRQRDLVLDIPREAVIVGCGGVGTWLGITLALAGTKRLLLIDHDTVEAHNLNRLPYSASAIGRNKAEVLRELVRVLRDDAIVTALPARFGDTVPLLSAWPYYRVYCCTDSTASQEEVYNYCIEFELEYRRIGYDGYHITVSQKPPPKWGEGESGYEVTPTWAGGAMVAAALATLPTDPGEETSIDLRRLLGRTDNDLH